MLPRTVLSKRPYINTSNPPVPIPRDLDALADAGDRVVAVTRLCGRPKDGRQDLELHETKVWKLRERKAVDVLAT
jgi:hypothetical protein